MCRGVELGSGRMEQGETWTRETHKEALVSVQMKGGESLNSGNSNEDMEEDGWGDVMGESIGLGDWLNEWRNEIEQRNKKWNSHVEQPWLMVTLTLKKKEKEKKQGFPNLGSEKER